VDKPVESVENTVYKIEPDSNGEYLHERFAASGKASGAGRFEILAMTAGIGNGWDFGADVLRASLQLWDKVECFVDHQLSTRSIRDLAGMLAAPAWDEGRQGIRAALVPMGPSAGVLEEMGKVILSAKDPGSPSGARSAPDVGFSADIIFKAKDKTVTKIVKVLSVDLVIDPARGGEFIRELYSKQAEFHHKESEMTEVVESKGQTAEVETLRNLLQVQTEQQRLAEEAEKARAVRAQMCEYLLSSALGAAKLPTAAGEQVRKQFSGRVFEPAELQTAIEDTRKLVSELTGALIVQGPGRIHGMFTTEDQLSAAVDDLLGAKRDPDKMGLKVAQLSGIRELYMMLTGDHDLHGGYHGDRAQFATTADFAGLVKNALNKIIVEKWGDMGRAGFNWWESIATVEHFNSVQSITGTLIGTVGSLPVVAEGGEYPELAVGDSPETGTFIKYGGYVPLTLELIDRDETRKLASYPKELAIAGLRKISELVAAIFTAPTAAGPALADGGLLFNATAVTSVGGHLNLLTTGLSAAQWEVVSAAVFNQPLLVKQALGYYGTGPKMGINPKYVLVPRALQLTAKKILYPGWENLANITSENQQQGSPGDVLTVPEWTDATDWAAVVDPRIAPAIFVGERFGIVPQIFVAGDDYSPAVFMNDESRLKIRHFLAVWVNDFRPLHKSNV
jgi:hypothetical protein